MTRAVIFDMFETLITHYKSPLYFGAQMAKDIGITETAFRKIWTPTEHDRSIGKITFEEVINYSNKIVLMCHERYDGAVYGSGYKNISLLG